MHLERAAVWRRGSAEGRLDLVARRGVFPVAPPSTLIIAHEGDEMDRAEILSGAPLRIDQEDRVPGWLRPIAGPRSFELALPLVADEGLIGLIALGPRWDEYIFDERDLVIAELIGRQATLFFTVAANIAELRRVPGRMADAQDRERQLLAQELHDTIQQFLGRLPFYLSFSRDALQNQPEKARQILDLIIADGEDTAASVRQIRYNLAPSQLERGLAGSLADLCRHFEERSGIATVANIAPEVDDRTTLDMRFAVYRVIQQALDNVEAHAGASAVAVALALQDGHIAFSVRDNGRGSTEAQRQVARERGSFGLESMSARLEAGGGEFELHSGPDGTEVRGRLPVAG
jgi:signal transduction histidine kinase